MIFRLRNTEDTETMLRLVLLAGWDREQRWFGGRRDLDYSALRVQWLCTPLRGKAKVQGSRLSKQIGRAHV